MFIKNNSQMLAGRNCVTIALHQKKKGKQKGKQKGKGNSGSGCLVGSGLQTGEGRET